MRTKYKSSRPYWENGRENTGTYFGEKGQESNSFNIHTKDPRGGISAGKYYGKVRRRCIALPCMRQLRHVS